MRARSCRHQQRSAKIRKRRESQWRMCSLDAITVGTWVVHRESCWGAQGTEENRCPEVAPGNPEWGDWWRCAFSDTLACLPYVTRAWPRTRGHIQPKAIGTVSQQSGPGWGGGVLGGTWEAPALMLQHAAESGGGQRMQPCLPRAFSSHTYLWEKFMVKPAKLLT